MEIEPLLELWAKNIHRLDESTIKRDCGVRAYGIEYRIMLEGGVAEIVSSGRALDFVADVDLVWTRIARSYPDHMAAVKEYYKRGSYRSVRLLLHCSQHSSTVLVRDGEKLIAGGLLMLM